MHHLKQIFFRSYLFKMFTLENLKNLNISSKILNTHAPIKEKHVRCNQSSFVNKQLRKAIMNGIRLLNKCRKDNSAGNPFAYKRQRNLCIKLLRHSKKFFYNILNVKRITDKRKFWQTIKPNFTDKTLKDERITLVDGEKVITEKKDVVKKLKDHFEKIAEILKIDRRILSDFI